MKPHIQVNFIESGTELTEVVSNKPRGFICL